MIEVVERVEALRVIAERYDLRSSAAIFAGDTVHLSGLSAVDRVSGEVLDGDIRAQARYTLELFELVLADLGLSLDHVVKVNAYLAEPARDFAAWNEVFLDVLAAPYPCRTTVGAPLVVGLIELDLVAARQPRR